MNFRNILWYKARQDGSRDVKIYVYAKGEKKYFSTGIKVEEEYWNEKTGYVKDTHPLARVYNAKIREARNRVEEHFLSGGTFRNFNEEAPSNSLLEFMDTYLQECRKGRFNYVEGTIRTYQALDLRLRQYAEHKRLSDISFDMVDMDFYNTFCQFLTSEGGCGLPGTGKHMKKLKRVMQVAMERGLHNNTAFQSTEFRAPQRRADKIFLSESEIHLLEKLHLPAHTPLRMERDRWLLAYYLVMRYSDVVRISRDGVFTDRGKKLYQHYSKKTNVQTVTPLSNKALAIMKAYDFNFRFSSNQVANRQIKVAAAIAGINAIVQEGSRQGPKSDFVTFHTARRSAATNLFLQGASLKAIADLGGWTDLETLKIYLRASGLDSARMASGLDFFK